MLIAVFVLFVEFLNLSLSQISFPAVSMPDVLSANSLVWITPAISAWTINSTNPTQFTYKVSNFSTIFNTNTSIIKLIVYKSPISNISFCYFETSDTFPHVIKLKSANNQTQTTSQMFNSTSNIRNFLFVDDYGFYSNSNGTIISKLYLSSAGSLISNFCAINNSFPMISMSFGNSKMFILYKNTTASNFAVKIMTYNQSTCSSQTSFNLVNLTYVDCLTFSKIIYDSASNLIILVCQAKLQIWSQTSLTLVQQKILDSLSMKNFAASASESCFCGPYLVILTTDQIIYYNKTGWSRVATQKFIQFNPPVIGVSGLSCVSNDGNIGFKASYATGTASIFLVTYNMTAVTNTSNFNSSANETNLSATNSSSPSNYIQDILKQSDFNFLTYFYLIFLNFLKSDEFNTTATIVATTTGIPSSNSLIKQVFKPFLYLIDQFWLYKFHAVSYNQVFQYFSTQTNLLNDFRIKPSFLDAEIKLPLVYEKNQKYSQTQPFNPRGPSTIFALQSLKEVYIFNFVLSFLQFVLIIILRKMTRKLLPFSFRFKKIYLFLYSNTIWWNLLVNTVESNIVVISFYASIQILCFYSFSFFDKINLFVTVFLLFIIICYSYLLYKLVYQYEKVKRSSIILDIGLFSYHGFLLQMSLNCLRRLNGALIHGLLINRHLLQLSSLIVSDVAFVIIVIKMRSQFKSKFFAFITLIYFMAFFVLDCSLFICTQTKFIQNSVNSQISNILNFVTVLMIIIILFMCTIKIIFYCADFAWNIFQFIRSKQDQTKSQKIKKQNIIKDQSRTAILQNIKYKKFTFDSEKNNRKQQAIILKIKKIDQAQRQRKPITKIKARIRKEDLKIISQHQF